MSVIKAPPTVQRTEPINSNTRLSNVVSVKLGPVTKLRHSFKGIREINNTYVIADNTESARRTVRP